MREKTTEYTNLIRNTLFSAGFILLLLGILVNDPYAFLFSTIFVIASNVIFTIQYLKDNFIFLLFNGTFTFFLLSRFIAAGLFGADYEYNGLFEMSFSDAITTKIILFIAISIISITLSYYYFYYKENKKKEDVSVFIALFFKLVKWLKNKFNIFLKKKKLNKKKAKKEKKENKILVFLKDNREEITIYLRWISLIIFLVSVSIQIFNVYKNIKLINEIGYREYYLLDKTDVDILTRIFDIIGRMYFTSFIIYIATSPKLGRSLVLSILFLTPGVLELKSGGRTEFVLNFLIILIYCVFRIKNEKLLRKIIIGGIILMPLLFIVLMLVESSRGTQNVGLNYELSFIDKILKFFYSQGVSARTIGNAQEFSKDIPYRFYSFGEIIDFVKYTILGHIVPGIVEPQGQSYEVLIGKSQLSHTLTFLQSPYDYLNKGLGTGSSYIAELYVDFRILGIVIGSMFYGYLLNTLRKLFYNDDIVLRIIMLVITRNLLLVPRASFTYFLNRMLQVTQIGTFLVVFMLSTITFMICRKRKRE